MKELIDALMMESIETTRRSLPLAPAIAAAAEIMIAALGRGKKILVCGNGGSAADAQHFAAELVGRFEMERRGLPCLALPTDTPMLTAWSNDYDYDTAFARQIATFGQAGDVLLGISTSGNSPSILRALEEADARQMHRITLSGRGGGALASYPNAQHVIVPSDTTSRIQEVHITILHIWCRLIDNAIAASSRA